MFKFKYREVGFGTRFNLVSGFRNSRESPGSLFENELVADVGGACLGWSDCTRPILDHHFYRGDGAQYPSAAAAILHQASGIIAHFRSLQDRLGENAEVWLVTHSAPDFDAYCSLFLARALLSGEIPTAGWDELGVHPGGWMEFPESKAKIDWYEPRVAYLRENQREHRWPILLAAYASAVDNCKPIRCSRASALHAVLYAAKERQRPLEDGALRFFVAARDAIRGQRQLNPLTDALFDNDSEFAPELELLAIEAERYHRDVRRARIAMVNLPCDNDFKTWFEGKACKMPLLNADGKLRQEHLDFGRQSSRQTDGIYLRDPESILFKEWARADIQNSPSHQGFLFTAVVYSSGANGKPRFVFSLDPERAAGAHLYPVWARLQEAEMSEMNKQEIPQGKDRKGFEGRQCGGDPWFDGNNYKCTIVENPNRGSLLAEGGDAGALDKPVALVRQQLEYDWFGARNAKVWDHHFDPGDAKPADDNPQSPGKEVCIHEAEKECPMKNAFRFAQIPLREATDLSNAQLKAQIGHSLWLLLEDQNVVTVPSDFLQRHLLGGNDLVLVWGRRGIAVAYKQRAAQEVSILNDSMRTWAWVTAGFEGLLLARRARRSEAAQIQSGKELLTELLLLKHKSSLPEGKALRRLFESTRMDDLVSTIQEFNEQDLAEIHQKAEKWRDITLQIVLAVGTGLGLVLAWNQVEDLKFNAVFGKQFQPKDLWNYGWDLGVVFIGAYFLLLACFLGRDFWRQRRGHRRGSSPHGLKGE